MADDDIAFAGAARQAEMVRAGEVSPTELVQLYLERIERLDPQLNSFRVVFAERALLEAEQAEARLKGGDERPLLGVPIAIKDEVDVAGEINTHGTDAFTEPAKADSEMVRRLREAGAIVRRPDAAAGAGDLRLHRVGHLRRHPQPLEPAAHAGGLERRQRRGGRRGPGPDRLGRRRRRLDPHPGRLLRSLRPEAAARPGLAGARARRLARARGRTAASAAPCSTPRSGSTSSPAAREEPGAPPPPERPFVESAQDAARQAAGRLLDRCRRARRRRRPSPTTPRARSPRPPSCCARSATRSPSAIPTGAGSATTSPPASCAASPKTVAEVPHPERLERRTRGFGRLGRLLPDSALRAGRGAGREADAARVNAIFDDHDVLMTPVMGGTALPVRRWEGRGRPAARCSG